MEKERNISSCSQIDLPFTRVFLPAVYVTVFIVGVFANSFGLKSVCCKWGKLGNINIFILNLGVADLLYVFTLPFLVMYYAGNSRWIFGQTLCKITRFCFNMNLYGSIGFLTCLSVYRYLGIVHPMWVMGRINTKISVTICVLVWILVIIQILPDMFFEKSKPNSSDSCYDTTTDQWISDYLSYSLGWTFTGFVVPLFIVFWCYGHIIILLATKTNMDTLLKQRCIRLICVLTLLFTVCFIPYHIFRNLNLLTRILKKQGICGESFDNIYIGHQVSRGLACLNSAMNPLIYVIGNDEVSMRLHNLSRRARKSFTHLTSAVIECKPKDYYSVVNIEMHCQNTE
ncbi:P2Y purinoceptor 1-like [Triplophysa dalaica]|uniref:P2Y purinoceptor 1-like n=1 Tax=Triplophysa dalaica TaxID=1582913 RepID=UPI0024DF8DCB|nr:P2Y purinoceptor 1-like [Triplophysa dalaica]